MKEPDPRQNPPLLDTELRPCLEQLWKMFGLIKIENSIEIN